MMKSRGDLSKIAAAIERSPKTQRQIAREVGVTDVSISHYVSKMRTPSAGNLVRLAEALGVSALELMKDGPE